MHAAQAKNSLVENKKHYKDSKCGPPEKKCECSCRDKYKSDRKICDNA